MLQWNSCYNNNNNNNNQFDDFNNKIFEILHVLLYGRVFNVDTAFRIY
uniref:Uncharacterized protein n=1 Tax=Anguilla anguilla TaxID=7936 RepID=A0A0E9TD93_ANGAN